MVAKASGAAVVRQRDGLAAIDADGVRWSVEFGCRPDSVIASAGDVFAHAESGEVARISGDSGELLWVSDGIRPFLESAGVHIVGEYLVVVTDEVAVYDRDSGERLVELPINEERDSIEESAVLGDSLVIASERGTIFSWSREDLARAAEHSRAVPPGESRVPDLCDL